MKRLVMIFVLVLWLPLGVGFTAPEEYDGSQDPEAWFFDSILDENGNLFLDSHQKYSVYEFSEAIWDILENRFGCFRTEAKAELTSPPSYQLNVHLYSLITSPPGKFELRENRYLTFAGCQYRSCPDKSFYFVDIIGKHIAVIAIQPTNIFSKERNEYGGPISDVKNPYKYMFLLPDAPEYFIQKSLEFANNIHYPTNRQTEIFAVDCQESN